MLWNYWQISVRRRGRYAKRMHKSSLQQCQEGLQWTATRITETGKQPGSGRWHFTHPFPVPARKTADQESILRQQPSSSAPAARPDFSYMPKQSFSSLTGARPSAALLYFGLFASSARSSLGPAQGRCSARSMKLERISAEVNGLFSPSNATRASLGGSQSFCELVLRQQLYLSRKFWLPKCGFQLSLDDRTEFQPSKSVMLDTTGSLQVQLDWGKAISLFPRLFPITTEGKTKLKYFHVKLAMTFSKGNNN